MSSQSFSLTNIFVAFDLDDTLYKEIDFVKSAYNHIALILSEKYVQHHNDILTIFGKNTNPFGPLCDFIKSIGGNEDIAWLLNEYRHHTPTLILDPIVEGCLIKLQNNDIPMGIITDGRVISQSNKIKALGLHKYISKKNIIISEEIGYDKHHDNGFKIIMSSNPNCDRFYYIGDNLTKDFCWPNKLGWTTVCIKDNGQNIHPQDFNIDKEYLPHHIINNFSILLSC